MQRDKWEIKFEERISGRTCRNEVVRVTGHGRSEYIVFMVTGTSCGLYIYIYKSRVHQASYYVPFVCAVRNLTP
jgi:hypothetical protein